MKPNLIIADDVREAKEKGRMVQIKCRNCQGGYVGNSRGLIIDHIKSNLKLHSCPTCGAETKIHPEAVSEIKTILGINI